MLRRAPMLSRRAAVVFGVGDVITAALVFVGVFAGLPARWAPVDVAAGLIIALKLASGLSLLGRWHRAERIATWGAAVALALGLALVTLVALSASWLAGIYGPVGRGGAIVLVLVAALVLPYLVVLPALELVWLRPRHVAKVLATWTLATTFACVAVCAVFSLREDAAHPKFVIASLWEHGERVGRAVLAHPGDRNSKIDETRASHPGAALIYENVTAEGPVLALAEAALALSFVPGRDGMSMTLGERTEYLTPDDLLAHQAYDKGIQFASIGLLAGADVPLARYLFSGRFGVPVRQLDAAKIRRIRVVRFAPDTPAQRVIHAATMTRQDVQDGAIAAARFLARGVDGQGRFRYLVDGPTNRDLPGYDWPRHAGATYYLAQVAALSGDTNVAAAALRSAAHMRDDAMVRCGKNRCIGSDRVVDVGSTALALLAFVEIARTELDPGYALVVPALAAFLRAQQRADGEFMHEYDRDRDAPNDVQLLYYSGEATLALSRAHALLGDARDLDAASKALARLAGKAWNFFGSRYYFNEEHWTCQAMADIWDRSPNRGALDLCLRWHAFGRRLQYAEGETPYDAEGAYGVGPLLAPHLTPTASRSEAALATLDAARRAGVSQAECAALEVQVRKSLAMLLRHQFHTGEAHLLADPAAVDGAMPASEVDWQLRIDFAQHAGSAWVAWLKVRPG